MSGLCSHGCHEVGVLLSIFSGIDLLGLAFEEQLCELCGCAVWCVVGFIDTKWGRDVRTFHPPAGVFEGVIGGDPCQWHSSLAHLVRHNGHQPRYPDMTGEYQRIIEEARPRWFIRENVPAAPLPEPRGYLVSAPVLSDAQCGGTQPRKRRICFGALDGNATYRWLAWVASLTARARQEGRRSIVADSRLGSTGTRIRHPGGGVLPHGESGSPARVTPIADACEAMGLPRDFTDDMPFTMHGKRSVIGNGVPMAMGRAVARAVREATNSEVRSQSEPGRTVHMITQPDCGVCGHAFHGRRCLTCIQTDAGVPCDGYEPILGAEATL